MSTLRYVLLMGLVACVACQIRDDDCGSSNDVRALMENPPAGFTINCINRRLVNQFLGDQETVRGVARCWTDGICDKPGYREFINIASQSFGTNSRCTSRCGKNARLLNMAAQRFHRQYPDVFKSILRSTRL